jgi:hypothetical protein
METLSHIRVLFHAGSSRNSRVMRCSCDRESESLSGSHAFSTTDESQHQHVDSSLFFDADHRHLRYGPSRRTLFVVLRNTRNGLRRLKNIRRVCDSCNPERPVFSLPDAPHSTFSNNPAFFPGALAASACARPPLFPDVLHSISSWLQESAHALRDSVLDFFASRLLGLCRACLHCNAVSYGFQGESPC